ncbi:hypothetical protein ACFVUW_11720 [Streptomyces xiamenensis]|uniref:hypothetical protein n=1 Tax=Streptomyces xiamenensis TaxID=408015 RepID=UPI0036EF3DE5
MTQQTVDLDGTSVEVTGETSADGTWHGRGQIDSPPWANIDSWIFSKLGFHVPTVFTSLPLDVLVLDLTIPKSGPKAYEVSLTVTLHPDAPTVTALITLSYTEGSSTGGGFTAGAQLIVDDADDRYIVTGGLTTATDGRVTLQAAWQDDDGISLNRLLHLAP